MPRACFITDLFKKKATPNKDGGFILPGRFRGEKGQGTPLQCGFGRVLSGDAQCAKTVEHFRKNFKQLL